MTEKMDIVENTELFKEFLEWKNRQNLTFSKSLKKKKITITVLIDDDSDFSDDEDE